MPKKNQKKTKAVVLVQQPKQKKKNKSKAKAGQLPGGEASKRYFTALTDPFNPKAFDVRVPDEFSAPTACYFSKQSLTISSDANGDIDLSIFPCLVQCAISSRGNISTGGQTWSPGVTGVTIANGFNGLDMNLVKSKLVNHRIVAYGVRIASVASMNNVAGKVYASTSPISSWAAQRTINLDNVAQIVDSTMTVDNILFAYGIPFSNSKVDITKVAMMPGGVVQSALQTANGALEVHPKIIDSSAYDFRSSDYTNGVGFNSFRQAAGNIYTADASAFRIAGHESVILAATGLPASTALFDVEIVYHLEGCLSQPGSSLQIQPSSRTNYAAVDLPGMFAAISRAATLPSFTNVTNAGIKTYGVIKSIMS